MICHQFDGVKYTVIIRDSGKMEALRYGEEWRDLTGDGLILAMLQDYDFLKEQDEIGDLQITSLLSEVEMLRNKNKELQLKHDYNGFYTALLMGLINEEEFNEEVEQLMKQSTNITS